MYKYINTYIILVPPELKPQVRCSVFLFTYSGQRISGEIQLAWSEIQLVQRRTMCARVPCRRRPHRDNVSNAARVRSRGPHDCFRAAAKILALVCMAFGVQLDQFTPLSFFLAEDGPKAGPAADTEDMAQLVLRVLRATRCT